MKKFNLFCPIRKANPYKKLAKALKTNNYAENILERRFEDFGPRYILLTDITYIPFNGSHLYLSAIKDAFTKQILSYKLSDNLEIDFVLDTVNSLYENYGSQIPKEAILHSDQGCHYTSNSFRELLINKELRQSMSRRGNCWDNAPQESFFGHMKDEIDISKCKTFDDVKTVIDDYMDYYNNKRYQYKLAKLSPNEFYDYWISGNYPLKDLIPEPKRKELLNPSLLVVSKHEELESTSI